MNEKNVADYMRDTEIYTALISGITALTCAFITGIFYWSMI